MASRSGEVDISLRDQVRNDLLLDVLGKPEQPSMLLDVGCGPGVVAELLEKLGYEVVGVDLNRDDVYAAKGRGVSHVMVADAYHLPLRGQAFKSAFTGDILEHLLEPERMLRETRRVLEGGGVLTLTVPNTGFYGYRLYYLFTGRIFPTEDTLDLPPWRWEHIRFYDRPIIQALLDEVGFRVERFYGIPLSNYGAKQIYRTGGRMLKASIFSLRLLQALLPMLHNLTTHLFVKATKTRD